MKYLYGDGTESTLSLNYLEYLRSALEFSTSVLKGDTKVTVQESVATEARAKAEEELSQLARLREKMVSALDASEVEMIADGAAACVKQLRSVTKSEIERAESSIQSNLASELQRVSQSIAAERAANEQHLEKLLLHHDLPESSTWVDAATDAGGNFFANLAGTSEIGVNFTIDLAIPGDNLLASPLKIDRINPELTIKVPQSAGWGRKGVKLRTFKLIKDYVVGMRHVGEDLLLQIRNAPSDGHSGFDITFGKERTLVTRISKQQAGEPFTADPDDVSNLVSIRDKIKNAMDELIKSRRALKEVKYNNIPLCEHVEPSKLVRALVDRMIPVVGEITKHSLAPGELVLKRVLSDDKREEVFASVSDLRGILDGLPEDKRSVFASLGFDGPVDFDALKAAASEEVASEEVATEEELDAEVDDLLDGMSGEEDDLDVLEENSLDEDVSDDEIVKEEQDVLTEVLDSEIEDLGTDDTILDDDVEDLAEMDDLEDLEDLDDIDGESLSVAPPRRSVPPPLKASRQSVPRLSAEPSAPRSPSSVPRPRKS